MKYRQTCYIPRHTRKKSSWSQFCQIMFKPSSRLFWSRGKCRGVYAFPRRFAVNICYSATCGIFHVKTLFCGDFHVVKTSFWIFKESSPRGKIPIEQMPLSPNFCRLTSIIPLASSIIQGKLWEILKGSVLQDFCRRMSLF